MAFEATRIASGDTIPHTPAGAIAAGEVVVISSNVVAIATQPIAATVEGTLVARGIFDVTKEAALGITAGDAVYWDDVADEADKTSTNDYMGTCIATAAAGDATVRINLRSIEAAAVETLALADLSDVDAAPGTDQHILIGDGDSYESMIVSGDVTITNAGVVTLNASKAYQQVIIHVEDLGAGADILDRPIFAHPVACTLVSAAILPDGAPAGVDAGNTSVFLLEDEAANAIVTETYDNVNIFPTSDYESLGALSADKVLTAEEIVLLSVTNGATADLPAFSIILTYEVTNV